MIIAKTKNSTHSSQNRKSPTKISLFCFLCISNVLVNKLIKLIPLTAHSEILNNKYTK